VHVNFNTDVVEEGFTVSKQALMRTVDPASHRASVSFAGRENLLRKAVDTGQAASHCIYTKIYHCMQSKALIAV
jgi:hypothetical protein